MDIDVSSVDEALATTRAVRIRLDLDRPVDDDIIHECIDIAEQAPSGGNQGSRRWIVVRDPAMKQKVADLYMEAAGHWMIQSYESLQGTGHKQERVMKSAAHLAEHLAEVPAIVIPTIIGVHDGSGRPGLFDSVIQSVWSFSVALRARGLGSAWTTAILSKQEDLMELLEIPEGMTPIAMLPVAWTKGTDFKRAPRYPSREITYIDGFARTWERGPSDPPSIADGPGAVVEVDIKAPPRAVWPLVSDISFGAAYSDEFQGAEWADGAEPGVGAVFIGTNSHPAGGDWQSQCTVIAYDPGKEFGWSTGDPDNTAARWHFELSGIAGATRLRYSVKLGPGPSGLTPAIEKMPDREPEIIHRRITEHRGNMQRVIDGIKEAVESSFDKGERDGVAPPLSDD